MLAGKTEKKFPWPYHGKKHFLTANWTFSL
jgi:hypothetical protein